METPPHSRREQLEALYSPMDPTRDSLGERERKEEHWKSEIRDYLLGQGSVRLHYKKIRRHFTRDGLVPDSLDQVIENCKDDFIRKKEFIGDSTPFSFIGLSVPFGAYWQTVTRTITGSGFHDTSEEFLFMPILWEVNEKIIAHSALKHESERTLLIENIQSCDFTFVSFLNRVADSIEAQGPDLNSLASFLRKVPFQHEDYRDILIAFLQKQSTIVVSDDKSVLKILTGSDQHKSVSKHFMSLLKIKKSVLTAKAKIQDRECQMGEYLLKAEEWRHKSLETSKMYEKAASDIGETVKRNISTLLTLEKILVYNDDPTGDILTGLLEDVIKSMKEKRNSGVDPERIQELMDELEAECEEVAVIQKSLSKPICEADSPTEEELTEVLESLDILSESTYPEVPSTFNVESLPLAPTSSIVSSSVGMSAHSRTKATLPNSCTSITR